MRIAIPTAQGQLCLHFGHSDAFALLDIDENAKTVTRTTYETPPEHAPGVLPRWLQEQQVNVVIAGGMGMRARGMLEQVGVKVIVGATPDAPETIAAQYLAGTLETGANVCDH